MDEEEKDTITPEERMTPEELKEYKKKRNAGYNRAMRQRAKENGDTINKERNKKRKSEKAIKTIKEEVAPFNLKKAKELPVASKVVKSEATKRKYRTFIKGFYRRYSGKELEDSSDIILKINERPYKALNVSKDFKGIIMDNIEEIKGKENYVKELYSIFRGVRGFTDIVKILRAYSLRYNELYIENRSKIEATEEDLRRIDFENKEEYEGNIDKLEDITDKVIYSFDVKYLDNYFTMSIYENHKGFFNKIKERYIFHHIKEQPQFYIVNYDEKYYELLKALNNYVGDHSCIEFKTLIKIRITKIIKLIIESCLIWFYYCHRNSSSRIV